MCQGFSHFSAFLHHFISAKLAESSIRLNRSNESGWLRINHYAAGGQFGYSSESTQKELSNEYQHDKV